MQLKKAATITSRGTAVNRLILHQRLNTMLHFHVQCTCAYVPPDRASMPAGRYSIQQANCQTGSRRTSLDISSRMSIKLP